MFLDNLKPCFKCYFKITLTQECLFSFPKDSPAPHTFGHVWVNRTDEPRAQGPVQGVPVTLWEGPAWAGRLPTPAPVTRGPSHHSACFLSLIVPFLRGKHTREK